MNIHLIATEIISKTVRLVSKKKFNSIIDFEKQVEKFIGSIKSNHVKLIFKNSKFEDKHKYQYWKVEFEVIFVFEDKYIDNKVYDSGTVHIFPSSEFYGDVNRNSMTMFEAYPEWNSTRTIATISGKARN